jgi:hypothetical protein
MEILVDKSFLAGMPKAELHLLINWKIMCLGAEKDYS